MNTRLLAAATLAALTACTGTSTAPETGAAFSEPNALAVFRGVTVASGIVDNPYYPYLPYLVVANASSNDLTVLDARNDALLPAAMPLRGLVYPVPGRPLLLAAADLGDRGPDLLAVVTAGDLPWLGGAQIEVIRTWAPDGAVAGVVDVGARVLALAALPPDPEAVGTAQLVAALADERIAVISIPRAKTGDTTAIDVGAAQVVTSGPLGFQPVDLAVVPGDRTRVFAATLDEVPVGSRVHGVAEISLAGTPAFVPPLLNALAPTRLVAAARLAEADLLRSLSSPVATALDATAFVDAAASTTRVYAVLDESGCGLNFPIACGVVALDPSSATRGSRAILPDPTSVTTMNAGYLAPLPFVATAGFSVAGPPVVQPTPATIDAQYAGTFMRIAPDAGWRQSTAAGAVSTTDGVLTFVDLARWDIPSQQLIRPNVTTKVTPSRATGTTGTQWLVLENSAGGTVTHVDTLNLTAAVTVTAGYTPTDRWLVVREGTLPGLVGLRAEAGNVGGTPWLALQQTALNGSVQGAVRLYDPTLGVRADDIVVIEPSGLGTCTTFEASVLDVVAPDATRPGGYVTLKPRVIPPDEPPVTAATQAMWDQCVAELATAAAPGRAPFFSATFRAGGYVLLRGNPPTVHVGRPEKGVPFQVLWQDENALATGCSAPPAQPWPGTAPCDTASGCRDRCQLLQQVRIARRIGYLVEAPTDATGPALGFTLALEQPTLAVPRDLGITFDTAEGRIRFAVGPTQDFPIDPRGVLPFDRSPWWAAMGVRFFVPYAGDVVLNGTPTAPKGWGITIR